jgi:hypothetical protein
MWVRTPPRAHIYLQTELLATGGRDGRALAIMSSVTFSDSQHANDK